MQSQHDLPVFYDARQRRWRWIKSLAAAAALVASVCAVVFSVSLILIPFLPRIHLEKPRYMADVDPFQPPFESKRHFRQLYLFRQEKNRLYRQIARLRHEAVPSRRSSSSKPFSVVAAYYVNWDETSLASLKLHIAQLTHVMPEWLSLSPVTGIYTDRRQIRHSKDPDSQMTALARRSRVAVLPMLNNFDEGAKAFRPDWLHALLADASRRLLLIARLKRFVQDSGYQGIHIDFETESAEDRDSLTAFMSELYRAFHPAGLLVTEAVQVESDVFDLAALSRFNDWLVPMLYDEHYAGMTAGPVASQPWYAAQLRRIARLLPPEKIVLGIGTQSYDWIKGRRGAASLTYEQAMLTAKENDGVVRLDSASLNPAYTYEDADDRDRPHEVWILDAVTAYNQIRAARPFRPLGAALWYAGSEDPALWQFYAPGKLGNPLPSAALETVRYGYEIDFEGEGEILSVQSLPTVGSRSLKSAPSSGLIVSERYSAYPSPYVVRRYGKANKKIALTFDDGPDPAYTPQILKILRDNGVKATFFVIGQNAENYSLLTQAIWRDGHDIGVHTFTHPDISRTSLRRTDLELTATQRVIESLLGRSTTLFRPPYAADAEPQTSEEMTPLVRAEALGYLTVGEMIDPTDWDTARTDADRIFSYTLEHRREGNIVLLHDGGGNREATVEALPRIIVSLKRQGYRFVTVSELLGKPRDAVFPPIHPADHLLIGVDKAVFEVSFLMHSALRFFFWLAILLGFSRVLITAALALFQSKRASRRAFDAAFAPSVSVVIAAYNEEKVIVRTVEAILESDYPDLEVIVVDDGSRDHTAEAVAERFAQEPKVRLLSKPNGGKASALNLGIRHARGEILVSLDADTLFARETISRLVRHFRCPEVGAVSGNVKVGNLVNFLTRWQAIEYITSQNFDRRAYDLLNCITVVPGAVGAWRCEAVKAAGLYTGETLTEDTDLTFKIRKLGYRIVTENEAQAYTEAPDSLKNLSRQRFRWAYGTLQNLWKHRDALFRSRYGAFGWVALPGMWLYQIVFQAISPLVDAAILWALLHGNARQVLFYYAFFFLTELAGAAVAFALDKEDFRLLAWLFWQRFLYRQLMYYVILKSLLTALKGGPVGWGKFERKGTVRKTAPSEAS
ncbi:MAG: glycosyltransferase [Armatimonadetes bacterium]|nr:glycosyltransferase [Armatimonadota bacterium]